MGQASSAGFVRKRSENCQRAILSVRLPHSCPTLLHTKQPLNNQRLSIVLTLYSANSSNISILGTKNSVPVCAVLKSKMRS